MDALGEPQSVLVLGGSSEIATATVKALPRARLKLLSRCDHVPPEQRPEEVVRLIRGFVK
jgi:pimeloyl-ACP methyl ester carboxylesterase